MKKKLCLFFFISLSLKSLSSPETIAISINSWSENFDRKSTNPKCEEIQSFFNSILLDFGYKVVERASVKILFDEYVDQTREDYLDGKIVKIKLQGAKDYLFIDLIEKDNSQLLLYYSLIDVFNENILFVGKLNLNANEIWTNLESNKARILSNFHENVGIKLFYYSFNLKETFNLINKSRSKLETGTEVYLKKKQNNVIVGTLKVIKQVSSNLVECTILEYDKKNGKLSEYDFSSSDFSTSDKNMDQTSNSITLKFSPSICINPEFYFECLYKLQSLVLLESGLHQDFIHFEQNLQVNEYFIDGVSYFKNKLLGLSYLNCTVKRTSENKCSLLILSEGKQMYNQEVSSPENILSIINYYLKNK
jgi:hypothetical protein